MLLEHFHLTLNDSSHRTARRVAEAACQRMAECRRIRYYAAEALISMGRFVRTDRSSAEQLARQLRPMLSDPSEEVVGVTGETEVRGRLYHWRSERRSLSEVAIRALLAIEAELTGPEVLEAMIAQLTGAIVQCGNTALTPQYCISQWRKVCEAAGGIPACEPMEMCV